MIQPIPRRWFPQKILPLTYDDSLSYYEFLCKILAKINEIIEVVGNKEMYNNLKNNIAEEYDKTKEYNENNYVWYNETLYKCKATTRGEFDETKWEVYKVSDYLFWILEQIGDVYDNLKNNIAKKYDKTEWYDKNDYVWYNDTLYKCNGTTTGDFNESKWEVCRVADYLLSLLEQISEMENADFWKVFRVIFTEYTNGYYSKGQIAFSKVNNHTIKIGVCKLDGTSTSFVEGNMWDISTLDINTNNFETGIIDGLYNVRIEENATHNKNNFAKICSILNSFAVWYDEPRDTPCLFKKYDLCWRVTADSMSTWYDSYTTYYDVALFYAKRNTNSGVEFSTDNWERIIPDVSGSVGVNQVSFADYIKAMIDEYGGGTAIISPRQNVRNNVISEAE